jgi:hypothetical protein
MLKWNPITGNFDYIRSIPFLDGRYVNTTGDLMTGGLGIQPSIDSLTALYVNDKDGNNVLTVDTVNNRVGIGTTNPGAKLDVTGNGGIIGKFTQTSAWTGSEYALSVTGYTNLNGFRINAADNVRALHKINAGGIMGFSTQGDDPITFTQSATVERMRIASGGNVGIGTTNPAAKLTIASTSAYESATLGSELLSSSNWTLGTGWSGDFSTGFTHTSGTADLSNTLAAVVNNYYQIAYTVTGRTAGSFTVAFGGESKASITATGTFGPKATATGSLVITPTSDFNGTIVVSIKQITSTYSPTFALYDSTNTSSFEIRNSLASLNNTFIGKNAGARNTTGYANSAQGLNALYSNTTGSNNSAQGVYALQNNTTGYYNSAQGVNALRSNTTGYYNSAQGVYALYSNTTGYGNSAQGVSALYSNTTGYYNSAQGVSALYSNTTGYANSAQGVNALQSNTTGNQNSAQGVNALRSNTTGYYNSAQGAYALYLNTTGYGNSAQGYAALYSNTTGNQNSAQGYAALYNLTGGYNNNTAIGYNSGRYYNGTTGNLTSVSNSLFLGASASALADGDTNEIVIGYNAIGNGSNTIKLGNTSITNVASNGDFEALDIGDGFILKSPDGTRYRITVANGGALSAVAV